MIIIIIKTITGTVQQFAKKDCTTMQVAEQRIVGRQWYHFFARQTAVMERFLLCQLLHFSARQ